MLFSVCLVCSSRQTSAKLKAPHSLGVQNLLSLESLFEEVAMHLSLFQGDIHAICHAYECPVHTEVCLKLRYISQLFNDDEIMSSR